MRGHILRDKSDAIILNNHTQDIFPLADQHIRSGGVGMQQHIGKRFLHDPEDGSFNLQRMTFAGNPNRFKLDIQICAAG